LECSHGLPAPIVAKNKFIKLNLELFAAHAVVGTDQPLLEITNRAVCQRQHGLGTFAQVDAHWLSASHMLKSGFLQPGKGFEAIGVHDRARYHILLQESQERCVFEIWDYSHASSGVTNLTTISLIFVGSGFVDELLPKTLAV
jgi:hypothetical protein